MTPLLTPFNYLIKHIIDSIKNNKKAIFIFLSIAFLILFNVLQYRSNTKLKKENAIATQNIKALNDTIRVTRERNGDSEYNRLALLTDKVSNLEKLNSDLANDVKNIKGKVSTIIKTDVKIVHDSVSLPTKIDTVNGQTVAWFIGDSTYSPGNYRRLKGVVNLSDSTTHILIDELGVRLKTGIKNMDKGKPEIFIQSDFPGFGVTSLEGAVLDPSLFHTKPTVHLVTLGFGVGFVPLAYDWKTQKLDLNLHRLGITAGLNFNIIKILKPNK